MIGLSFDEVCAPHLCLSLLSVTARPHREALSHHAQRALAPIRVQASFQRINFNGFKMKKLKILGHKVSIGFALRWLYRRVVGVLACIGLGAATDSSMDKIAPKWLHVLLPENIEQGHETGAVQQPSATGELRELAARLEVRLHKALEDADRHARDRETVLHKQLLHTMRADIKEQMEALSADVRRHVEMTCATAPISR